MMSWLTFWNKENKIDVSVEHSRAHYAVLGHGVLDILPSNRPLRLLDWGCGDALATPLFIEHGIEVFLYDPAERFHARTRARFFQNSKVTIVTSHDIAHKAEGSVDAVLVYSVLQYISREDFESALRIFRRLLPPGGLLILGDIVPRSHPMILDVYDLLVAGIKHGFFLSALAGLFSTFFSEYRLVRNQNGFTTYTEQEMFSLLLTHGFAPNRISKNIGLSSHRMLVVGVRTTEADLA
jgi:SAM-dependent methyltransferase